MSGLSPDTGFAPLIPPPGRDSTVPTGGAPGISSRVVPGVTAPIQRSTTRDTVVIRPTPGATITLTPPRDTSRTKVDSIRRNGVTIPVRPPDTTRRRPPF